MTEARVRDAGGRAAEWRRRENEALAGMLEPETGLLSLGMPEDGFRFQRRTSEQALEDARRAADEARARVIEARRLVRVVEKLKERLEAEERLEAQRRGERELNDLNAVRHG